MTKENRTVAVVVGISLAIALVVWGTLAFLSRTRQSQLEKKAAEERQFQKDLESADKTIKDSDLFIAETQKRTRLLELKNKGNGLTAQERVELEHLPEEVDDLRRRYLEARKGRLDSVEAEELRILSEREARRRMERGY